MMDYGLEYNFDHTFLDMLPQNYSYNLFDK